MFRTHVLFTLLIGLLLFPYFDNGWKFFVYLFIGSFIPDLDLNKGKLGRMVPGSRIVGFLFGHRGLFHSLFLGIILGIIVELLFNFGFVFFIGFFSHVFLDGFTKRGVRLFYPLKFNINGNVKTNGIIEKMVYFGLFVIDAILIAKFLS